MKKNRISTLNKSIFFFDLFNESRKRNRNRINNINTLILKTYMEAMNSDNTFIWKDTINKELQNFYR